MIAPESYPKHSDRVIAQQVADTLVLLGIDNGQYYSLEDVGCRVWELSDGTRSVSEMIDAICAEYDAPSDVVTVDVLELLDDLARDRLVLVDDWEGLSPSPASA